MRTKAEFVFCKGRKARLLLDVYDVSATVALWESVMRTKAAAEFCVAAVL